MKIRQLIADKTLSGVQRVTPQTSIRDTAQRFLDLQVSALIVSGHDDVLLGIVSERDLVDVVARAAPGVVDRPVSTIMTSTVITCDTNEDIADILRMMNTNTIRHMPVVSDGKLVNMVSIRELTKAYELLQIEANTDPLTELSNRRPFLRTLTEEFDRARAQAHPLAVAMIDLDNFKRVNDTFGHEAGDAVLRQISGLLITEFRTIDLIGRLGGEEFAVVFPETTLEGARIACERLLKGIRGAKIKVGTDEIRVTASIGLAPMTRIHKEPSQVLKCADELLYQAKSNGRDRLILQDGFTVWVAEAG